MDILHEIIDAEKRIRQYILKTPVLESKELSKLIEGKVYLKLESEQHTGSFKARGSLNKVLSLTPSARKRGLVTASTGNHALGFARALEIVHCKGDIYLPENASVAKVKTLANYNVSLKFQGSNGLATEMAGKENALKEGKIWVSPYNDLQVMAGQGTIGIELIEQLDHFDYALINVGGGGLIGGTGTYLKEKRPRTKVISCQPVNAPEMAMSIEAGEIVGLTEPLYTIADGCAGGIEEGSITFPVCQHVIDESMLVSEAEIVSAMRFVAHTHHKIIEGAAAVPVACLIKNKEHFKGCTVVIVICGANIDIEKFKTLV